MEQAKPNRIYGVDVLRAVAMFLGIILHGVLAYRYNPHFNIQPHDDEMRSYIFDFVYFIIHSFRMPVFFIIAGFFARLLMLKIGDAAFVKHRLKRVFLPFLVGFLIIVPFSLLPLYMYDYVYLNGNTWEEGFRLSFHRLMRVNGVYHLWFLHNLLLFYAVVVVARRLLRLNWFSSIYNNLFHGLGFSKMSYQRYLAFNIICVFLVLLMVKTLYVFVDVSVVPKKYSYLLFYWVLFCSGWVLNMRYDLMHSIEKSRLALLSVGAVLCIILFYYEFFMGHSDTFVWVGAKFLVAVQIITTCFGVLGYFLHYFKKGSAFWKYISDASYWVYLIHISIVVWIQLLLMNSPVPGMLRFPIVIVGTTFLSLLSYHYLVRYTFIGRILHGSRRKTVKH